MSKRVQLLNYPELVASAPRGLCVCPLCGDSDYANYPYDSFVIRHKHLIKRYVYWIMTGRNYSTWLKEYWADVKTAKGQKK
jgi:hypothetical protein